MKFKFLIFLFLSVLSPALFSSCASVESKEAEEVVFTHADSGPPEEVFITNSDLQKDKGAIPTIQPGGQISKTALGDRSEVETIVDPFGNKIETRRFADHPRLQSVMIRTSADGKQQVTVYGAGGETRIIPELDNKVLSASADEIADAANLTARSGASGSFNFMKARTPQSEPSLQPLPSSQFPKPVAPVQAQTENKPESVETSQAQTEKDIED